MTKMFAYVLPAALVFAACGDSAKQLAAAQPATGATLETYSRNITRAFQLGNDASLVQLFCRNATKERCPSDIGAKLKDYGFADNLDGVDLAYAFVGIAADAKDGTPDKSSSDEDFLASAYQVVLNREPDQSGALDNLKYIKESGERKNMLRSMLESKEFRDLK
jgi:Domain of unknown function (DUF4214)